MFGGAVRKRAGRLGRVLAGFAVLSLVATLLTLLQSPRATAEPVLPSAPDTVTVSQRSTMVIASWPVVAGADGYTVELDTMPTFSAPRRVVTADTMSVVTGLTPDTGYYLRIASWAEDPSTFGSWSSLYPFSTGPQEFAKLPPVVKTDSLTSTSITAEWTDVDKDLSYEVALGKQPDDLTSTKQVKDQTATFDELEKVTKYYVSVRAVDEAGAPVTAWSDPVDQKTAKELPLRVGSYNILCENCSGGKATWASRRGPLVDAIQEQDLDVLGVQEASIGSIPGGGAQYMDLINRLGKPYKLTEYGRKISPDVRIVYNSERVELVKQGTIALPRGDSARFLNWAVFEQKSSGKRFFFTNTHLEPKDGKKYWNTRNRQTRAIVAATKRLAGDLPVVAVGDYASTKWDEPSNGPYDIMQAAGYKDPLGNAARSRNSAPGEFVEKRINTSYASLNMYKRQARNFAGDVNGSNTDYIFVSTMRVPEYEVVVKVNDAGQFVGVIPSDHNLIRATVLLP